MVFVHLIFAFLRVKYVYPQALPITKNIIIESNKHFTTFAHCHKISTIRQDGTFAINIHCISLFHSRKFLEPYLEKVMNLYDLYLR